MPKIYKGPVLYTLCVHFPHVVTLPREVVPDHLLLEAACQTLSSNKSLSEKKKKETNKHSPKKNPLSAKERNISAILNKHISCVQIVQVRSTIRLLSL